MSAIIGRTEEIAQLQKAYKSSKSEFVALYGRRRVGKTFLVREFFNYSFSFQLSGLANATTPQQLASFHATYLRHDESSLADIPKNWLEAFQTLIFYLEKQKTEEKLVIFLDELPWLDTSGSDFVMALEHFWNSWATNRKDVLLITCGSAASWMLNTLINNHGGLHNRVTYRMMVEPFTLHEADLLLKANGCVFDHYQTLQIYMVTGGVPFYLEQIQPGLSAAQNIERLCFRKRGLLALEFNNLFSSLFKKSEKHEALIQALAQKPLGLTRKALAGITKFSSGGSLTRYLNELEESGFIASFPVFGKKSSTHSMYRLVDFYSLFYLKFIKNNNDFDEGVWVQSVDHPAQRAWFGHAFELVCLQHIDQIKKALHIGGVLTRQSYWKSKSSENGAQIDLVIDRRDQVLNLCEIKFSINQFSISKDYAAKLRNKIGSFREETNTRKTTFLTFISTFGLKENMHSQSLVQQSLTMEVLFEK